MSLAADTDITGLTAVQQAAARQDGAVVVLAGAGTGKTRTLVAGVVDRIRRRGLPPSRILAVTFTNRAADEMRVRIAQALGAEQTPSWIGTFHGHGRRQLRQDPEIAGLRAGFDICDAEDSRRIIKRLLGEAMQAGALEAGGGDELRKRIKGITTRIALFKDDLVLPEQAMGVVQTFVARYGQADAEDQSLWQMAAALYAPYQAVLRETNRADFGDLLFYPTVAMMRDEAYRRDWAARFDALLADEFQDVNRLQFLWLKLLSRDHGQILSVGDDAQSIYSWRGAHVGFIRHFSREFPGARLIALEENFRSTGHILAAANAVIARDPERLEKTLFTRAGAGEPVEVVAFTGAQDEAQGIALEIGRRLLAGVPPQEIAILYRYNFLSRQLEEQLLRLKIPYELVNDTGFWQRACIRDALALLRLAESPDDPQSDEAFRRVINVPARGVGAKTLAKIEALAQARALSLFAAAEDLYIQATGQVAQGVRAFLMLIRREGLGGEPSLGARLRGLGERSGYLPMLRLAAEDGSTGLENLEELYGLADGFSTVEDLMDHAALGSAPAGDQEVGRVRLMTIHAAKGLEYAHVFLMGWEETLFPAPGTANPEEERRLAYVALTRGRRRVSITWCRWRNGRASGVSGFVEDIPPASLHRGWRRSPLPQL
ncbi:ATP-dependent helicase [Acetobacter vaccinii]|uniref:DNA 3'-5' helicase n=1 Tax=Acetobacter vaccinii TaxID=2592655 RepID=A0A5C1YUC1_9PROT|nr:ATP-dependent helicase [Acetobacter vaccinii]QEO18787.1 ATP-dependent helicase [Acetobacter vaccinii]